MGDSVLSTGSFRTYVIRI